MDLEVIINIYRLIYNLVLYKLFSRYNIKYIYSVFFL